MQNCEMKLTWQSSQNGLSVACSLSPLSLSLMPSQKREKEKFSNLVLKWPVKPLAFVVGVDDRRLWSSDGKNTCQICTGRNCVIAVIFSRSSLIPWLPIIDNLIRNRIHVILEKKKRCLQRNAEYNWCQEISEKTESFQGKCETSSLRLKLFTIS